MAAKKKTTPKKEPREMVLVQSKVKTFVRGYEVNVAGDLADELNEQVHLLLEKAVARCVANGRKTVRGSDL